MVSPHQEYYGHFWLPPSPEGYSRAGKDEERATNTLKGLQRFPNEASLEKSQLKGDTIEVYQMMHVEAKGIR